MSTDTSPPAPRADTSTPRGGRVRLIVTVVLLLAAAGNGVGLWWGLSHRPKPEPNWTAVYRANNRGVGHMEQFDYRAAIVAFEEVVELAPDWWPGHVNLGIALLNRGGKEEAEAKKTGKTARAAKNNFQRAIAIVKEVPKREDGNKEDEPDWRYGLRRWY